MSSSSINKKIRKKKLKRVWVELTGTRIPGPNNLHVSHHKLSLHKTT